MGLAASRPLLTFVIGCTGSGKGQFGRALARRTGGEIISADSMKVYRRMDIGTAKPPPGVRAEIPHHLIDVVEPSVDFSVAQYVELADAAIASVHARRRPIFVVGGTPMYIKAVSEGLFEGPSADGAIRTRLRAEATEAGTGPLHERLRRVDPAAAQRIHPNDLRRIVRALEVFELTGQPISALQTQWDREHRRYECLFIGLQRERADQNQRTNQRVQRMFEAGFVEEVAALLREPVPLSRTAGKALGYAEIIEHLEGRASLAEAVENIKINTRHLAKAQRTWFKRFTLAEWIELKLEDDPELLAEQLVARYGSVWSPSPR
ncbi:MAG TPA: tRNA (adenosine(37)-N6)-dimethylallyltransferase MiaA [Phycisphaerae bacterium]|nr:tRNA (adenosine(37)-N6)-dimethylallyltransferase MiaA [Phycisphaerae bacterium]HNU45591.1 tRNA (adenosine(37)-N6)-dimethylallyltransferase MiaA [Phycisphaerae bacterium]